LKFQDVSRQMDRWRGGTSVALQTDVTVEHKGDVRMENRIIAAAAGLLGGIETLSFLMLLCQA